MENRASVSLLTRVRAWIGDIVKAGDKEYVVLENFKAGSYTVRSMDGYVPQEEETLEHSDLLKVAKKDDWPNVEKGDQYDIPPSWAYSDNVADIAVAGGSRNRGAALALRNVAGAAIPRAFVVMLMLWTFYPVFFVITLNSAVCKENGFSTYPLRNWFAFAPIVLACYCLEFAAFRIAFVPLYQVLKEKIFLVFGRPLGFHLWFLKASCQSLLAYFSFATNSAFAGTAIATMDQAGECNRDFVDDLHEKWDKMMETAMFGIWQKIDWTPTFHNVIVFALSAQAIKLVLALCQTVPTQGFWRVHYEYVLDSRSNEEESSRKKVVEYRTCLHREGVGGALQNHGAALMALANANGLNTIFDCETKYAGERTLQDWEKYANEDHWEKNKLKIVAHPEGQLNRAFGQLSEAILGSGLLLNIKTSMWALVGSVTKTQLLYERAGALQAFYIIVGAITCGLNLIKMYKTITFVKKWIGPSAGNNRVDAGGLNILVIRLWFVQFLVCVFAFEVCYAVGKLVYGIGFCPADAQMVNVFSWQHCA